MNFINKTKLFFIYVAVSLIKDWKFYKRIISNVENCQADTTELSLDEIKKIGAEIYLSVAKLIVFLPIKSNCLQRSLLVYKYLSDIGVRTEFIVGIRVIPYSFHCWIEYKGAVIFDSPQDNQLYRAKTLKVNEYIKSSIQNRKSGI